MAKVTILRTNKGTRILGAMQCSNMAYWDAEGCFRYCNCENTDVKNKHQASKLETISTLLGHDSVTDREWWKNRDNFVDVEIDFETMQEYRKE